MTREEAVKWLKNLKNGIGRYQHEDLWHYEQAIDEIIEALKRDDWISVKDRLPEEEADVLILIREIEYYGRHKEKRAMYRWIFTGWCVDGEWATTYCHGHRKLYEEIKSDPRSEYTVTHWMPLPEPPSEEVE